tara:strand:- start:435 stop:731 length:297 start_codon:yes stop_codon:yes gene_type:complete
MLLQDKKIKYKIIEYVKTPLKKDEVLSLSMKLGKRPKKFVRFREKDFKDNNLKTHIEDDDKMAEYIARFPKIMERPIVVRGETAIVARPPEKILELLK